MSLLFLRWIQKLLRVWDQFTLLHVEKIFHEGPCSTNLPVRPNAVGSLNTTFALDGNPLKNYQHLRLIPTLEFTVVQLSGCLDRCNISNRKLEVIHLLASFFVCPLVPARRLQTPELHAPLPLHLLRHAAALGASGRLVIATRLAVTPRSRHLAIMCRPLLAAHCVEPVRIVQLHRPQVLSGLGLGPLVDFRLVLRRSRHDASRTSAGTLAPVFRRRLGNRPREARRFGAGRTRRRR